MSVEVTWYGHSAVGITTPMVKILIDPFFNGNDVAPVGPGDVEADVIAVTHGHPDHLGDTREIATRTGAKIISNFEIISHLERPASEDSVAHYRQASDSSDKEGLTNVHALHIGGGRSFDWGRIRLTQAWHGSAMPDGSYGGVAAGVRLYLGGIRIYHAGDTGLFSDMKLIGKPGLDLALLPIGDNFTMGPDDALEAVKFLKPKQVIPIHYNTFEVINQDAAEWAARVSKETSAKVLLPEPGEVITLGIED